MTPLRFETARECVIARVLEHRRVPRVERLSLQCGNGQCADGRILADDVHADRNYPPFARSIRDGFAVLAQGFRGQATVIGEVRAGEVFSGRLGPGQAVEIMTGAPLPEGADAVIMVEHVKQDGGVIRAQHQVNSGDFVSSIGSDCRAGERLLESGQRLGFSSIAVLASTGLTKVPVYQRPRVAIIGTGDELVELEENPAVYQIRNSNSYSLAAQVSRSGGHPAITPIARDNYKSSRDLIEAGLESDLLLISGGVSAGKYDIVEKVLADVGAEFYFDRVLIQPGQPVVFGRARETFFFGLPGNPASTTVTFAIFARTALELIAGARQAPLHISYGRLSQDFTHKPGLTRFLPATLGDKDASVTPVKYNGSGDVFALARANCFLIARDDRESWRSGDLIEVLPH